MKPKKPTVGERIARDYWCRDDVGIYDAARTRGLASAIDRALRRAFRDGIAAEQHDGIHSPKSDLGCRNRELLCRKYGVKP